MIVYKIENALNGKVYIGQSVVGVERRWKQHLSAAHKNYKYGCPKLYRAIRKYDPEMFIREVIFESQNQEEIDAEEIAAIVRYNSIDNGYNIQLGGKLTKGHSQETRDKMSKTRKGKKPYEMTDDTRQKMSEALKGRAYHNNLSEEGRKSISEKTSFRLKGQKLPDAAYENLKTKTYDITHPDGTEERIENLREFSRNHTLNYDCMIQIVRGKQKQHKGYKVSEVK